MKSCRTFLIVVFAIAAALSGWAQTSRSFPLESSEGLRAANVSVEPASLDGRRGIRVTMDPKVRQRLLAMTAGQRDAAIKAGNTVEQLAVVEGLTSGMAPLRSTHVRIEVRGSQGRLFVHGQTQPTLIVNDLKTGATARGGVALWIDVGTQAHFRNLIVVPAN